MQLEKYQQLDERWGFLIESMTAEFKAFEEKHEKIKAVLPEGKNLAELQGMSRREKDANQLFDDKSRDFED